MCIRDRLSGYSGYIGRDYAAGNAAGVYAASASFEMGHSRLDLSLIHIFNIPLITNARLASAFINAFCTMTPDDLAIRAWDAFSPFVRLLRSMYGNAAIYCPSAPGRYFTCFLCRLYFPNKRNPIFVWSDSFSLHFLNDFLCYTSPNTF